jgi:hypothetical protein
LSVKGSLDYVLSIRTEAAKLSFEELAAEIEALLKAVNARWEKE